MDVGLGLVVLAGQARRAHVGFPDVDHAAARGWGDCTLARGVGKEFWERRATESRTPVVVRGFKNSPRRRLGRSGRGENE